MSDANITNDGPIVARPASTVMLVRDVTAGGVEVFMVRRNARAVFAADMYVFPGGAVDPEDGPGDEGYKVAGVRECFEEVGVLLARDAHGAPYRFPEGSEERFSRDRHAVHAGQLSINDLARREAITLDTAGLHWVAHWVTPEGEGSRRFDTRFYVAAAPDGQEPLHDHGETVASLWVDPLDAIARGDNGDLMLMPPTIANLRFLAAYDTVHDVLRAAAAIGTPPEILPRLRPPAPAPDGQPRRRPPISVSVPGDPDYDSLA